MKKTALKQPSTNHDVYTLAIVGICLLVASIGIVRQYKLQLSPSPSPAVKPIQSADSFKKVIQPNALFYTKIFLNRDHTFISIPLRFDQGPQSIWLSFSAQSGHSPIDRLVTHPTLAKLEWPFTRQDDITLYQKEPVYDSLQAFIKNPPLKAVIMADPRLQNVSSFSRLPLTPLPDDPQQINLDKVDFILTTYIPNPRIENDTIYYETTIDTTYALINEDQEITWLLVAPLASEDFPWYIGNIDVDYR